MIDFITTNGTTLLQIVTGIVFVASLIVKLTPTPKDDEVVGKIMSIVEKLALNKRN